jgi:DNA-binding CsgD family transcriptional regulator
MLDLVGFLMSRPNSDQIAQHLVLKLMNGYHTKAAVISVFLPDATLNEVGMFGMSPSALEVYRNLALETSTPMTDAVRSGDPVIITAAEQVAARYAWMESQGIPFEPLAVWPLTLPDEFVGGVQFTFSHSPDVDALRADIPGVAAVLALYLSMLRDSGAGHGQPPSTSDRLSGPPAIEGLSLQPVPALHESPESMSPFDAPSARATLTARQSLILTMMAKGMTNSQISDSIGFSESTVSQESLGIYRYFGVHCRREAVRLATDRGVIGRPPN